jgi:Integrase core domain.
MAQEQKYLNQRLSTFELNQILSNASIQYRKSKTNSIYLNELKNYFQNAGIENLKNLPAIPKSHPRKTSARISDAIIISSLEHPGWGCVRLEQALKSQGISVSSPTIQKILIQHHMGNKNERLWKIEEKALTGEVNLNQEQIALIEKFNPCFRERFNESSRPGEILAQDFMLVGFLNGIGKIYLQSVVDTYNSFAFGFLHTGKFPDNAVAILHNDVLPFFQQYRIRVNTIATNNNRQYSGTENHHYELYLLLNDIGHRKSPVHDGRSNGFNQRFNRIALNEFFKKAFQKKSYDSIEKLQVDFDQWLLSYNNERPHNGYRNMGLPPAAIYQKYFAQ